MTSYQKLKLKYEKAQAQNNLFKNALSIHRKQETTINDNGNLSLQEKMFIQRNKILDERIKEELVYWVVENLDKESVMKLLEMKERLENEIH